MNDSFSFWEAYKRIYRFWMLVSSFFFEKVVGMSVFFRDAIVIPNDRHTNTVKNKCMNTASIIIMAFDYQLIRTKSVIWFLFSYFSQIYQKNAELRAHALILLYLNLLYNIHMLILYLLELTVTCAITFVNKLYINKLGVYSFVRLIWI